MPRTPEYDERMRRKNVTLPPHLIRAAREISPKGELSDGLRRAIEHYQECEDREK